MAADSQNEKEVPSSVPEDGGSDPVEIASTTGASDAAATAPQEPSLHDPNIGPKPDNESGRPASLHPPNLTGDADEDEDPVGYAEKSVIQKRGARCGSS